LALPTWRNQIFQMISSAAPYPISLDFSLKGTLTFTNLTTNTDWVGMLRAVRQ
jgi:hypothetical protein